MKSAFYKSKRVFDAFCCSSYLRTHSIIRTFQSMILFVVGCALFLVGTTTLAFAFDIGVDFGGGGNSSNGGYNDAMIKNAVCQLYRLIEGAFGALVMTVAGIAAIVSSAFGAYRAAVGMLVVGLGAFILRSLVSLFFGEFSCGGFGFSIGPIDVTLPGGVNIGF